MSKSFWEAQAEFWNEQHLKCFGEYPSPVIVVGGQVDHVLRVQAAVIEHHVKEMDKIIAEMKGMVK